MSSKEADRWLQAAEEAYPLAVRLLGEMVAIPSVAAQHREIPAAASYVKRSVEALGGEALIYDDLPGNPVVYGFFAAGPGGDADRTLLFYNHYDVQPEEPAEEWESPPFALTEREGKLFGRGVGDNKGDIAARLAAVDLLRRQPGGLPCNVKFMVEGEEEIGSPNLAPYVARYAESFAADACIWEFGYKDEGERQGLVAGLRGLLYLELVCKGADQDQHSLAGGYIDNPVLRLAHALSSLKDPNGEVLVAGFHDDAQAPTPEELEAVRQLPFDGEAIKRLYGLRLPLLTERSGKDPRVVTAFESLLTVCGIQGGYTGSGAKTLIPSEAMAKVEARLAAGQEPQRILELLRAHLDRHGYDDIQIRVLNDRQRGFRSDLSDPFVQLVRSTAEELYPDGVTLTPSHPGCGPMYDLGSVLQLPIVSTGIGWIGSRYHAPNENVRIADLKQGIAHIALLLSRFGGQPSTN
ncbi:acetylornithine deacetylase [Paenibacillus sp. 598K]|uniref:M20/M25/M40 family metallo-hydrolase n=1 Tax=Paenibacillus sp. 598K TaxID=1117987 RepID=UPI000FFA7077|nr:M20/M25/M40 family metallo-hydrolase [Paenibacillus sp. 598K]GBF72473.1 acetylornithine deacetylase [Paenibacillus sp. 598K]